MYELIFFRIETFGVLVYALMFIRTHPTIALIPKHVFNYQCKHLPEKVKRIPEGGDNRSTVAVFIQTFGVWAKKFYH